MTPFALETVILSVYYFFTSGNKTAEHWSLWAVFKNMFR